MKKPKCHITTETLSPDKLILFCQDRIQAQLAPGIKALVEMLSARNRKGDHRNDVMPGLESTTCTAIHPLSPHILHSLSLSHLREI